MSSCVLGLTQHPVICGGLYFNPHQNPQKRGARIGGLVKHTQVAQLICTFTIPHVDFIILTVSIF